MHSARLSYGIKILCRDYKHIDMLVFKRWGMEIKRGQEEGTQRNSRGRYGYRRERREGRKPGEG